MIGVIIGFLSGIMAGMGMGGGLIMIPALLFFLEVSQHVAQGINLIAFLPAALITTIINIHRKNIDKESLKIYLPYGMLGAIAGAVATMFIEPAPLGKISAWLFLAIGVVLLVKSFVNQSKQ